MEYDLFNQPQHELDSHRPFQYNGAGYEARHDQARLTGQTLKIYDLMKDGIFRTLEEIKSATGYPEASISAQLRHLRKERFGSHTVNHQRRGDRTSGLWEYQLIPNKNIAGN